MVGRRSSRGSCSLLSVLIAALIWPDAAISNVSEDDVKLVLLYKIARFVTWPELDSRGDAVFRLCVAGEETFEIARSRLADRQIRDRSIELVRANRVSDELACDVVYIADSDRDRVADLLSHFAARPVLTVSDVPEFARMGGIVGLSTENKRVQMNINIAAYERAGLEISSQLLELAVLVDGESVVSR
ncbi:MAG: YfiR family protein [Pseudomonadota bacterium]